MTRELTVEAQAERDDFERAYGSDGNCACHLSPPCNSCIHPGNPLNQDEDESCWVQLPPEPSPEQNSVRVGPVLMTITTADGQRIELYGSDLRVSGQVENLSGERIPSIEVPRSATFNLDVTPEQQEALRKWIERQNRPRYRQMGHEPRDRQPRGQKAQWKRERSKFSR